MTDASCGPIDPNQDDGSNGPQLWTSSARSAHGERVPMRLCKGRLPANAPYVRVWVCAVTRRRFPVGASPTRQPLQPEATGAVTEEIGQPINSASVQKPERRDKITAGKVRNNRVEGSEAMLYQKRLFEAVGKGVRRRRGTGSFLKQRL